MRRLLGFPSLVAMAAMACAPAAPPAAPEPPPPAAPSEPKSEPAPKQITGAWGWNGDVQVFRAGGTGTYYRSGSVCYEFTYKIEGDVVTKTADRDHTCGATRESAFHFHFEKDELVMKHRGSGFESRWKPAQSP